VSPRNDRCRSCYLKSVRKTMRYRRTCTQCGKVWMSTVATKTHCSAVCVRVSLGLLPSTLRSRFSAPGRSRGICCKCGEDCESFVCTECLKMNKRIARQRYRMRRRGATGLGRYDPKAVARADGWLCYLCGGSVAPHLWGLMNPNAPSIDHVIPISKGGMDCISNVRLTHLLCNMRKGAKVVTW
jgi:hypothetical protein